MHADIVIVGYRTNTALATVWTVLVSMWSARYSVVMRIPINIYTKLFNWLAMVDFISRGLLREAAQLQDNLLSYSATATICYHYCILLQKLSEYFETASTQIDTAFIFLISRDSTLFISTTPRTWSM